MDTPVTSSYQRIDSGVLQFVTPEEAPGWDDYVRAHDKGTIFHTAGMHKVIQATPKNYPWSLAAVNSDGEIVAIVCAVRVETVGSIASRFASRSVWYAEPLCDETEEGSRALEMLIKAHDKAMRGRVLFTEIRAINRQADEHQALTNQGYEFRDYLNYIVQLQGTADLKEQLSKSTRKAIRKCAKRGVEIQVTTTHESIDQMYELVAFSYDRSSIPLVDVQMFHAALDILGRDVVEVRLAHLDDQVVAGGITLKFKDRVFAWYGGALRIRGMGLFAALTWDEIEAGQKEGYQYYDFGGAGWPDEEYGPRDFKSKFGGDLVCYGRYQKIDSAWKLKAAKCAFNTLKKAKSLLRKDGN